MVLDISNGTFYVKRGHVIIKLCLSSWSFLEVIMSRTKFLMNGFVQCMLKSYSKRVHELSRVEDN